MSGTQVNVRYMVGDVAEAADGAFVAGVHVRLDPGLARRVEHLEGEVDAVGEGGAERLREAEGRAAGEGVPVEAAEEFVAGDPFVTNGVVGRWRIVEWREALA